MCNESGEKRILSIEELWYGEGNFTSIFPFKYAQSRKKLGKRSRRCDNSLWMDEIGKVQFAGAKS